MRLEAFLFLLVGLGLHLIAQQAAEALAGYARRAGNTNLAEVEQAAETDRHHAASLCWRCRAAAQSATMRRIRFDSGRRSSSAARSTNRRNSAGRTTVT